MPQPLMHQHQQVVNFSPQFPLSSAARRPAVYTSRLGDLSAKLNEDPKDSEASAQVQTQEQRLKPLALQLDQLAPYEGEYPLSLIASPRGLRMGTGTLQANLAGNLAPLPLHRVRRDSEDVNERDHERQSKRRARHQRSLPRADSTSVQTRKTIQVVSPDDVAFSLLEEGDSSPSAVAGYDSEPTVTGTSAMSRRRRIQDSQVAASGSSVCFSTTRFLWTLVVTLAALLSSIVIVAYVILRQRSLLEQKLSAVYTVEPQPQFTAAQQQQATPTPMVGQRQLHNHHLLEGSYLHLNGAHCGQQQQRVASRQREETRRRNNYLARLYSQFAPASYWR